MTEYEYMYGRRGKWEAGSDEVISDQILFYAE
jgi:hypothetical protein